MPEDALQAIAKRAGELADKPMDWLRGSYPETTVTRTELVNFCKVRGFTRGYIIHHILLAEFGGLD